MELGTVANPLSPFLISSLEDFEHSQEHLKNGRPVDRKYAVIHADSAVHLVFLEKLRCLGVSLLDPQNPRNTKGFYTCLKELKDFLRETEYTDLEIIHEERNLCQHRAHKPDETKANWICSIVGNFLRRFCSAEFGINLDTEVPERVPPAEEQMIKDQLDYADYAYSFEHYEDAVISAFGALDSALRHRFGTEQLRDLDSWLNSDTKLEIQQIRNVRNELAHNPRSKGLGKREAQKYINIVRSLIKEIIASSEG